MTYDTNTLLTSKICLKSKHERGFCFRKINASVALADNFDFSSETILCLGSDFQYFKYVHFEGVLSAKFDNKCQDDEKVMIWRLCS